jgi:tRNA-binding protein
MAQHLTTDHWSVAMAETIAWDDFERVDIRVGTITDAQPFPQARKPAYRLVIDFGAEIGTKRSSAQLTVHYRPDQLIGRQVCAVVNFPPRQIGPFISEVLTLGMPDEEGAVVLVKPDFKVPNGGKLF